MGKELKQYIIIFSLLLPSLLIILSLYLYPLILCFTTSFTDEGSGSFTFRYYEYIFSVYRDDVLFTIWICLIGALVPGFIALMLASYIRLSEDVRLKKMYNALYRFPLFIPMVVVAQMMRSFLAPHGYLNTLLSYLGLISLEYPPYFFDWKGMLIGFAWKQAAFMTLVILSGFVMVHDAYIEAARVVGASKWTIIWRILVPMSKSSVAIAFILTFASNVGTFTLPYMLIGGDRPTTITVQIAHRVTYFGDWNTANALGVISYVIVGVFSIYYLKIMVARGVYER